jgi:ADP-glucose pyrophosphorylase
MGHQVFAVFDKTNKFLMFNCLTLQPHSEGQRQMTRAIVAVELLHVSKNGIMEFKETPTVNEVTIDSKPFTPHTASHSIYICNYIHWLIIL